MGVEIHLKSIYMVGKSKQYHKFVRLAFITILPLCTFLPFAVSVIGGWWNTKSVIRPPPDSQDVVEHLHEPLSGEEYREFIVRVLGSIVTVYEGRLEPQEFLNYEKQDGNEE